MSCNMEGPVGFLLELTNKCFVCQQKNVVLKDLKQKKINEKKNRSSLSHLPIFLTCTWQIRLFTLTPPHLTCLFSFVVRPNQLHLSSTYYYNSSSSSFIMVDSAVEFGANKIQRRSMTVKTCDKSISEY